MPLLSDQFGLHFCHPLTIYFLLLNGFASNMKCLFLIITCIIWDKANNFLTKMSWFISHFYLECRNPLYLLNGIYFNMKHLFRIIWDKIYKSCLVISWIMAPFHLEFWLNFWYTLCYFSMDLFQTWNSYLSLLTTSCTQEK